VPLMLSKLRTDATVPCFRLQVSLPGGVENVREVAL